MGFFGFLYRQRTFTPQPLPANIRLSGQTAIVTGANVGLGFESSKELIQHGVSRIILAVRSLQKGEQAKKELQSVAGTKCTIEVWQLDNDNFQSITDFGRRAATLDRLDIVLLNAGVKQTEYIASPTGHESCVQVNHLATALLSLLLLPTLRATAKHYGKPSRMTIVSSEVHMWVKFPERKSPNILARLDEPETFGFPERYNVSKLLNVFWARELASKVSGSEVVINFVNPGLCASALHRTDNGAAMRTFSRIFAWTSEQGGHCLTDAVVNQPPTSHGGYFSEQRATQVSPLVLSEEGKHLQTKLWNETIAIFRTEAPNANIDTI